MFKHFVKLTANAAPIKLLLLSGAFIVCSYYTVGFLCFVSALHSRSSSVYSETLQAFRLCLFRSFQCPLTILACSFFSPPPSLSGCVFSPLCVFLSLSSALFCGVHPLQAWPVYEGGGGGDANGQIDLLKTAVHESTHPSSSSLTSVPPPPALSLSLSPSSLYPYCGAPRTGS